MNEFTFTKIGFAQYLYWQKQDKKTLRRIDEKNRLVYMIDELHY